MKYLHDNKLVEENISALFKRKSISLFSSTFYTRHSLVSNFYLMSCDYIMQNLFHDLAP